MPQTNMQVPKGPGRMAILFRGLILPHTLNHQVVAYFFGRIASLDDRPLPERVWWAMAWPLGWAPAARAL